jgi:hypothetical protein
MMPKTILLLLITLTTLGCYNAAMMRVSGEIRDTCQSDSDCPANYMCVRNVSASSTLGECVHQDNYDPWANRQLEDIIKLKNQKQLEDQKQLEEGLPKDEIEANDPDSRWWLPPEEEKELIKEQQIDDTKEECRCIL